MTFISDDWMIKMCKLAHMIRYTVLSQNVHFAVLERWLMMMKLSAVLFNASITVVADALNGLTRRCR